jgi:hypothetical protein
LLSFAENFFHAQHACLGFSISFVGRSPEPAFGLTEVSLHSLAILIHFTKIELSIDISLVGRFPEPAHGLAEVSLHSLAIPEHDTKVVTPWPLLNMTPRLL